jgi:hypothetical protein
MIQYTVLSAQYLASTATSPAEAIAAGDAVEPSTWTDFAEDVFVTEDTLTFILTDGRIVSAPLAWYPRLAHGTPDECNNWEIGSGIGVHWPDLDEDISVEGMLRGQPSGESQKSFQRWLIRRKINKTATANFRK